MAYKLLISRDAHNDIDEITTYIAQVLKNPQAAGSFLDDVEKSYRNLLDNPRMYSYCADEGLQRKGYRKIAIKNYLILYRVDETEKIIFIVRVVYGARDYTKLL